MYPTTSCPCSDCPVIPEYNWVPEPANTVPSSLAVSNCDIPLELQYCTDSLIYKQSIEPAVGPHSDKNLLLNPLGIQLQTQSYIPLDKINISKGCQKGFLPTNPLFVNDVTGQRMVVNRPNYTGSLAVGMTRCDEIYTEKISNYGKNYKGYSDINAGQIQYYIPEDIEHAYYAPNFVTPAIVEHKLKSNPMGVIYPQYDRLPLQEHDWDPCAPDECDSYTHDQLDFRQGIMERQMRGSNQQRYSARWYG